MKIRLLVLLIVIAVILSGCMRLHRKSASSAIPQANAVAAPAAAPAVGQFIAGEKSSTGAPLEPAASVQQSRMLVWTATLEIEVESTTESLAKAVALAEGCGGYAESQINGNRTSSVTLRLPSSAFTNSMGTLEKLGNLLSRNVQGRDVTEQYVDLDARSKTMTELRDRMRALLSQTKDIKEILTIEAELNRIQSELDSMQARLKVLKAQVDFATISLTFHQVQPPDPPAPPEPPTPMRIYGPVGILVKGLGWGLEKLWIIRE